MNLTNFVCRIKPSFVVPSAGLVCIVSILCLIGLVVQQCRRRRRTYIGRRMVNDDEFSPLLSGRNEPDI